MILHYNPKNSTSGKCQICVRPQSPYPPQKYLLSFLKENIKLMEKLLSKYNQSFDRVMYATRSGRKTVLHMKDGSLIETFLPIKRLTEESPEGMFLSVNKGVILSESSIASFEKNVYTMNDGARFKGRVRKKVNRSGEKNFSAVRRKEWNRYSIMDNFPIAFCVIELVFDEHGHGIDFIFRYCNKQMEILEGRSISEMLNRSFYEVFENGDVKWLVTYADVALNGVQRTIDSYSPEIGSNLRIYCYQPQPNFCGCVLMKSPAEQ